MSIQLPLTIGLDTYDKAYAKITQKTSDNNGDKTNITYHVTVWKSQAHKEAGEQPIDHDRYEVVITDLQGTDFAALYQHLAQQEKYAAGVAV